MTPNKQKCRFIKIQNFCHKEGHNQQNCKGNIRDGRFANGKSDKRLLSKIYKELLKLKTLKMKNII